ncbi:uncharacterized protein LOC108909966 [Anoplophora glabripennis]|uniref:uncharacterized protein LOC108909966 n=1 Tax=Anoplophora glabripennis TaxID=217634 RepID=UPI0008737011|nr:uncharacterized protein LOC108909966 [Anoplophora glabripennis]
MAANEYKHSGKTWAPSPTYADGNCFFHALFGEETELDGKRFYFDKRASFRRLYWAAFLMFFQHGEMSDTLLETLQKCFIASDSFVDKSPRDPDDYNEYIRNVAVGQYWVLVEEIPILSTLWNVTVVLFLGEHDQPKVFQPDPQILTGFPFGSIVPVREQVIRLSDHHFERLSVAGEPSTSLADSFVSGTSSDGDDSDEEVGDSLYKDRKRYKKGGSAGVQGSLYQIDVITLVLFNALKKFKHWLLSTENVAAGKFDDLVMESPEGDVLIQAKHKDENNKGKRKIINYDALLSPTTSAFSLAKYLFSFQEIRTRFKLKNIVICTNADLQTDKNMEGLVAPHTITEESVLHFKGAANTFYTFTDGMVEELKQSVQKYTPNTKTCFSDEDIKEFLSYLQFFPNYMNKETIDSVVDELVPSLSLAQDLDTKDTFKNVHGVILEWFKNGEGQYMSKLEAKAILCDIRTTRYCKTFETYDVSFKNDLVSIQRNTKMIIHVIPARELITLSAVRIYRALQQNKTVNALFLDPNDSLSVQKQVVEGFSHPRYTVLVITAPTWRNDDVIHKMCRKIVKILENSKYKKLVLVTEEKDKLGRCMKELNLDSYGEIREEIRFHDLTEEAQNALKRKRNIIFQGTPMTLEELVVEDLDSIVDSEVLEKLAKNDTITIGYKLAHADVTIEDYYIYRTLKRGEEDIPEERFRHLEDFEERIVLISDSAGMGKTTILANLAVKIKENHPSRWVVRIDLNNQSGAFKAAAKKRAKSIGVVDLLNAQEGTKFTGDFTRRLFLKPNNVVLMLDAVDEISSGYMEMVVTMMAEAKAEKNFVKIFVTTRPHLRRALEDRLEVKAFTLEPFSKDDQVDFLTKYWTQRLRLRGTEDKQRCQQYSQALIDEMSRWIDEDAGNTFAGIPLQTRMLAEVFQQRNQRDEGVPNQWEECKEFLYSGKAEPHLPKRINLIQLYELFIAKKRDIFVDDKGKAEGNAPSEQALKDKFEECHKFHRVLALANIFYSSECQFFGCYREQGPFTKAFVKDYVLRAGIVQEVDEEANFIHRTFAEYFAAECLILELKKGSFHDKFQEFLLEEILIRETYFVVRAFFDSFLQKELPAIPEDTLRAFCETDYLSVLDHSRKSYLHLLAHEGSVGIMEFLFACSSFRMTEDDSPEEDKGTFVDATDMELNTPLHDACSMGHLNVVVALVERGANVNFENANGETPLHRAALGRHSDVVEYLADKAGVNLNKANSYGESALLLAARKGTLKIIKFLIKRGAAPTGAYTTALHIAASVGKLNVVKYLIKKCRVDVDVLDVDQCTPLHDASHEGHLEVVKYLVKHGSQVNATNGDLNTAFHAAALRGYVYLVIYFIENGADTTIANKEGQTIVDLIEWLKTLDEESSDDDREETGVDSEEEEGSEKSEGSEDEREGDTSQNDDASGKRKPISDVDEN